jgi:ribosomal protein L23
MSTHSKTLRCDPQADHHRKSNNGVRNMVRLFLKWHIDSNKPQIKEAVEALFGVKVKAVNTDDHQR